jgi:deazaflavin-dependent oxidoreductase (nitroreductase family)
LKEWVDIMWYDPVVKLLLLSPMHGLISSGVLLLSYAGRKTGKIYRVPLSYVRDGNELIILTFKHRTWWKNLVGGAPVNVRLKGENIEAIAEPEVEDFERIKQGFSKYIENNSYLSRALEVPLDEEGKPDPEALEIAAEGRVMVWIKLSEENESEDSEMEQIVS